MTNKRNGTLYIGQTEDLHKRVWQHKAKIIPGFTQKYGLNQCVYFETLDSREAAREREKNMKAWLRQWKINLIETANPHWQDLLPMLDYNDTPATWTPACTGDIGEK